ncbi:TetR/AcrR family transcriptional regulator [Jeotgalibacillus sp. R-1-5s-1]|uniref:TetR/AcrR family transcriptional regulator n=1 Tax=Jeotgalibacillus sp. R-1-5s-1 TaxID=2555897 RepID=UPI00106C9CD0|nr:TetR/AcrR family transcriptional regulator [Jeotgalibacillus sp. R-1-5s-1]TFD94370.1 TetR/AcrR family transcriptional regulator [Jeotgalibacillus sp. R-1-5s-1]
MTSNTYHHGDLRKNLIENGLVLLNKEGIDGFSLRKVAALCGVSHTAPYRHFKNKEELIHEIAQEVWRSFSSALADAVNAYPENPKLQIIEMGKRYVQFLVEKPEYLSFIFMSDSAIPIQVSKTGIHSQVDAFNVFSESAKNYFHAASIDPAVHKEKTLLMWSMVHGMALLVAKKNLIYQGDYMELIENMLVQYLD